MSSKQVQLESFVYLIPSKLFDSRTTLILNAWASYKVLAREAEGALCDEDLLLMKRRLQP